MKSKQSHHKQQSSESYHLQAQHKKRFHLKSAHNNKDRCSKCGGHSPPGGSPVSSKKYQCKACHKFGHFTNMCFQKRKANFKPKRPKAHQLQAGAVYVKGSDSYDHLYEESTTEDWFCLQVKIRCKQDKEQKVPRPTHLITNLAYKLKPHHTRNLYFRARPDTCTDVSLIPGSITSLCLVMPKCKN